MNVVRTAYWLDLNENDKIFCWLHYPDAQLKRSAVVIIGAIGPEYSHCFRTIRLLADELAISGYATVRYDPVGMGNSTGTLEDDALWEAWCDTPHRLKSLLNELGFDNIIFIGFRSGSLILSEYLNNAPIDTAIFVHPYLHGRAYYRDMQMLDLGLNIAHEGSAVIEGGGYPVTENTKIALGEINLTSQSFNQLDNVLVISDSENVASSKFVRQLVNDDVSVESLYTDDLAAMIRPAAESVVPEPTIHSICDWIPKTETLTECRADFAPKLCEQLSARHYTESVFKLDNERSVFGILTSPSECAAVTVAVFVNAGAGHHVGPNRLHVDVSRELVERGVASLRMDLSNLGDSVRLYEKEQYHPYPSSAAGDIENILNYLELHFEYKNIVLCGLCSGAHNVFHAALRKGYSHLTKIILINPLTFYWTPGQSILAPEDNKSEIDEVYYQEQAYDYKKWLALIMSPEKIIKILKFILQLVGRKLNHLFAQFSEVLGVASLDRMNSDLMRLLESGIKIALITSKNDPGEKIMLSNASRAVSKYIKKGELTCSTITNADHTFSSRSSREKLINELINSITKPEK